MNFEIPTKGNEKLKKIKERIAENSKLKGYVRNANVNAMNRLMYSDHGPTHMKIVANAALKIFRILTDRGVAPSVVEHHGLDKEDAEVVTILGAAFHDIGMAIHRKDHDVMGVSIARDLLENILEGIYEEGEKTIIISEILGTIYTHDGRAETLTMEAGIVELADALDMAEGRARIPYEAGKKDIHSVSAMAIKEVEINEGDEGEKPVKIKIHMKSEAGIFQVDELLKKKVLASGLKEYFDIVADIETGGEEKVLKSLDFE